MWLRSGAPADRLSISVWFGREVSMLPDTVRNILSDAHVRLPTYCENQPLRLATYARRSGHEASDRLLHDSQVLTLLGERYRLRENRRADIFPGRAVLRGKFVWAPESARR